tara:strand:+ start:1919 stop:2089 length:171 start_codon:yes stop_codon:yes gene_type:complete
MKTKEEIEDKIKDLEKGVEILTDLIGKGMSEKTTNDLKEVKKKALIDIETLNWVLN